MNRLLTRFGLLVYIAILITSFFHVLHSFLQYSTTTIQLGNITIPGWVSGLGVAIGLDLAIIYFSFVSVLLNSKNAKQGGIWAMLLVWFAVLHSMIWEHIVAQRWVEVVVGTVLSLFVPLTSLRIGQVLGEINKQPDYIPISQIADKLGTDTRTILSTIRSDENTEVRLMRRNKEWYIHPEDVEVVHASVQDNTHK